jgi:flagellar basal-body rod modification protein FlgD
MDTTPVSSIGASAAASTGSAAQDAQKSLSANFDTFLTLLTTQLKNQDPLSPMDSNQFTQQLVEFSQVEQQIHSNQNLESLISLTKANSATTAVSYLGKSLTLTDGTAPLMNGQAKWAYSLDNDSSTTKLVITDATGKIVYAGTGETTSGMHAFTWDGKDNSGNTLPDGVYTLKVAAQTADGSSVGTRVASQGTVTEVDLTGTEPLLMIGPMGVPLSKASLVSN